MLHSQFYKSMSYLKWEKIWLSLCLLKTSAIYSLQLCLRSSTEKFKIIQRKNTANHDCGLWNHILHFPIPKLETRQHLFLWWQPPPINSVFITGNICEDVRLSTLTQHTLNYREIDRERLKNEHLNKLSVR